MASLTVKAEQNSDQQQKNLQASANHAQQTITVTSLSADLDQSAGNQPSISPIPQTQTPVTLTSQALNQFKTPLQVQLPQHQQQSQFTQPTVIQAINQLGQPIQVQVQTLVNPEQLQQLQAQGIQTLTAVPAIAVQNSTNDNVTATQTIVAAADDNRKRRDILSRRPSYRKILNDLSSTDVSKVDEELSNKQQSLNNTIQVTSVEDTINQAAIQTGAIATVTGTGQQTITMTLPTSTIAALQPSSVAPNVITMTVPGNVMAGLQTGNAQQGAARMALAGQTIQLSSDAIQSLQSMTAANAATPTILQYQQDNTQQQFFVPAGAEMSTYQIRAPTATTLPQNVVMTTATPNLTTAHQIAEDAARKRGLRLMKNREAARECRRKKKEYVKCLENRVAVLENQNKTLIEELKQLKELYCQKQE